jgi:hypothetical protein
MSALGKVWHVRKAIPKPALILAILAFAAVQTTMHAIFIHEHDPLPLVVRFLFILFCGIALSSYILLSGYVYRDASRRGMPRVPWTLIAFFIPYGVGFVLYFLLRKPLLRPCTHCGHAIGPEQAFCSFCGGPQQNMEKQRTWRVS